MVGNLGWSWLYVPFIFSGLALFSQGLGLPLSTANARFGDVQYIVAVVLAALYFLTPVLYPVSAIPADAAWLRTFVDHQPVSLLRPGSPRRPLLLDGPGVVARPGCFCRMGVFVAGLWIFDRTTEDVGEML